MKKTVSKEYHIAYGRHSLIPNCCIQFYVTEWEPFYETKWRETAYHELIYKSEYDYVPCPACFFGNNRVVIRDCVTECKRNCWKEIQ